MGEGSAEGGRNAEPAVPETCGRERQAWLSPDVPAATAAAAHASRKPSGWRGRSVSSRGAAGQRCVEQSEAVRAIDKLFQLGELS